ncbi:MAG: glycine dehydrogenase (aminomethyl-transferring), partial [Verrucomicrobia bacterium]|nr:glycine dehydrogenase (aminomethyl-transferring) [Verrucomicrobiota bacterium]
MSFTDAAAISAAYELSPFTERHIGPSGKELSDLLRVVGFESLDQLVDVAVPDKIRLRRPLNLPLGESEAEVLDRLQELARLNQVAKSYIGLGYYGTVTPAVIR